MTTNAKINAGGRLQAMAPDRQAFFLLRTVFTAAPILLVAVWLLGIIINLLVWAASTTWPCGTSAWSWARWL